MCYNVGVMFCMDFVRSLGKKELNRKNCPLLKLMVGIWTRKVAFSGLLILSFILNQQTAHTSYTVQGPSTNNKGYSCGYSWSNKCVIIRSHALHCSQGN